MKEFVAHINDREVKFAVDSPVLPSHIKKIISDASPDSLKQQEWYRKGYHIIDILDSKEHQEMLLVATDLIKKTFKKLSIQYDDKFTIENYHHYIQDDEMHATVTRVTRDFDTDDLSVFVNLIYSRLTQKLGIKFATRNTKTDHEVLILRINRPASQDMNPPHRDAYQDVWAKSLNIWYKLTGDNKTSTLPLIESSHFFCESTVKRTDCGSIMNGKRYNVPIITDTPVGLKFFRPELKPGQIMIFTPCLIHGLAVNHGDVTRTAVELRPVVVD